MMTTMMMMTMTMMMITTTMMITTLPIGMVCTRPDQNGTQSEKSGDLQNFGGRKNWRQIAKLWRQNKMEANMNTNFTWV